MQSEYLRALARNRQYRGSLLRDGSQQQKSQRTLNQLSLLLQEFNTENEFLTRQVKDLMQENRLLKKTSSRQRITSEVVRYPSSQHYTKAVSRPIITREPVQRKFVFDTARTHYQPYRTISKAPPAAGGQSQPSLRQHNMDRIVTPSPNYIPSTHNTLPQTSQIIEVSRTQPIEIIAEQPRLNNGSQQIEHGTPLQSESRRRSVEKRGIEVTSKSKSPKNRQRQSNTAQQNSNRIELISPKRPVASEAAVQVTPNLHKNSQQSTTRARIITENISVKLEPTHAQVRVEPFQPEAPPRESVRVDTFAAEQQQSTSRPYDLKIKEPQPTASIRQNNLIDVDRPSESERLAGLPRPQYDHEKYYHPTSTLPQRFATITSIQPPNNDNPRRPRILDTRDDSARRRGDSTQRKQYLTLVGRNRNTAV